VEPKEAHSQALQLYQTIITYYEQKQFSLGTT